MRVKEMLVPSLMSGVSVMGYIGPFFVEYNLNPQLLPVQYPATYAHEMAHVLGVSNEAEANPSASARTTTFPAVTDERNNARFTPHSTGSFSDKI